MKNTNKKSNVCIIANNLAKNGLNRSEAFRRAWAAVKTPEIETKVAGVTFGKRQTAIEHLTHYEAEQISISLSRDSENQYDANAVTVIVTVEKKGSYTIGYLPKALASTVAPLIDAQKAVKATFKEIRGKYQSYHNYGLVVGLKI